jgi:hypothetical protein
MEPSRARSPWWPPLIASSCLLVLLVVAVVLVAADRAGRRTRASSAGRPPGALVDSCLVGTWRTVTDQQRLTLTGLGRVTVTGHGVLVRIGPDGTDRQEYAGAAPYTGDPDGHHLEITVTGAVRGTIRTAAGTITFRDMTADGTVTATVDGVTVTSVPLAVGTDPVRYTCAGDTLTEQGSQYQVTLSRVSRST